MMRKLITLLLTFLISTAVADPILHVTSKPTTPGQPGQIALDDNLGNMYEWTRAKGWTLIGVLNLPGSIANAPTFSNFIGPSPFPSVADPTDQVVLPVGFPSSGGPTLTNKLSLVFGSSNTTTPNPCGTPCAVTSRAIMDQHVEHNQIAGNAGANVDGVVKDVNPAFIAAFRSYPAGDPHDTTVIDPDALTFHAYCTAGNPAGSSCQGAGQSGAIVSGIIRPETAVLPGDLTEVCYKAPSGKASWGTSWAFGGQYPPAGTTPNFYATGGFPYITSQYYESDNPDGFAITDNVSPIHDLTYAYPHNQDPSRMLPYGNPVRLYAANSGKYSLSPTGTDNMVTTDDRSAAAHCYQTWIKAPVYPDEATRIAGGTPTTPGQIVQYIDGVMVKANIDNWGFGNVLSWDNKVITGAIPPASLMISLQYGPTFLPQSVASMTPAGVAADTMKVYSLRVWKVTGGTMPGPTLANGVTPPPAIVAGPHRYWRVAINGNAYNNSYGGMAELAMATTAGGASVTTGGVAIASNSFAENSAARAFDNNTATNWIDQNIPSWIGYDFGAGQAQSIAEIRITARNDSQNGANTAPSIFSVQWSDDGTNWVVRKSYSASTPWAIGGTQTFAVPASNGNN